MPSFCFAVYNEEVGRILLRQKMRNAFFVFKKQNVGLLKTYSLPLILVFTLVNSELKNFSSDKVTLKWLIINDLMCHLSLVTFAFTFTTVHENPLTFT